MSRFPRWWFWAAGLVPAALTVAGLAIQGGSIERTVEANARAVLPAAKLVVDGRDVTVSGVPVELMPQVRNAVNDAEGVRSVSIVEPQLPRLRMVFHANEVTVTGSTEVPAWREQFIRRIGAQTHGRKLVDETKAVPGTDFPITTQAAETVVALLTQQPTDMTVTVEPRKVTVAGFVPDATRRAAIIAVMKRLFGDGVVLDQTKTKE